MIDIEINGVERVNIARRIDQIQRRIASIEEKIGIGNVADFQVTLEREIQRQAKISIEPTQAVADVQKIPGLTQPVNENDVANAAKVAEALREAEKIETKQNPPVDKKSSDEKISPVENSAPDKIHGQQRTPAQIERVEVPDTELAIPERDETIRDDEYLSTDDELISIEELIAQAAAAYGVDPQLVRAIAVAESNMNQDEISEVGAIGVMQLMPETAAGLGVNPYDERENIEGGTIYLKQMLDAFDGDIPLAVAAYNAGPNAVKRYGGIPPYSETQHYVGRVMDMYQ